MYEKPNHSPRAVVNSGVRNIRTFQHLLFFVCFLLRVCCCISALEYYYLAGGLQ